MALSGPRKAALLLMGMDQSTAAELLKSAAPEMVTQIAAEMSYLESAAPGELQIEEDPAREFVGMISSGSKVQKDDGQYVRALLVGALGEERCEAVLSDAKRLLEIRDPFLPLRDESIDDISQSLKGESPQVAALVLAEMTSSNASKLLNLLDEELRPAAIRGMASADRVSPEAKLRVAATVRERLADMKAKRAEAAATGAVVVETGDAHKEQEAREQRLRKVSVLLRGLAVEARTNMITAIREQDSETAQIVQKMMVVWEDIPILGDRALQEVMRSADSRKLAMAMVGADAVIVEKARANMSERAAAMLDEEASLLSDPKEDEIVEARELVLNDMRELNEQGMLEFEEA